jgi:uncharacterized DUF497 family protein
MIPSMRIVDIVWLPWVIDKLDWKHGVLPDEVDELLFSAPYFRKVQRGHSPGENVYAALGQTGAGRYLIVFFVYKKTREAVVISGRDMTERERRLYERR